MSSKQQQSAGREANNALPPGERPGLVSSDGVTTTGLRERQTAGPDGPDAGKVGKTFKRPPGETSADADQTSPAKPSERRPS